MSLIVLLRRFIQILRADTAPHQVGLGLALGVLVGLPPFGAATLAFVGLFLIFNANLGAFLAGAVIAKILGFVLASTFEMLGSVLLEMGALQGFWTWLLNLPGLAICGFDLYQRLGATVVALLVGVLLYLVSLRVVTPIRLALAKKIEGSPRLKKMSESGPLGLVLRLFFGKQKHKLDEIEGGGWIRKGFVVPLVVGVLGFSVFWWLGGAGVTKQAIQWLASTASGKDVNLGSARLSFLGGSLGIGDVDVLEPKPADDPRIAEGQTLVFDVNPWAVFGRRVVVDELAVENLKYFAGTRAEGDPPPEDPPEPPKGSEGKPVGVLDVWEWVEAHQREVEWVLEKLDGMVSKDRSPGEPGPESEDEAAKKGLGGRAEYVYGTRSKPLLVAREAAVRNLLFDWRDTKGPLTPLERLDLSLTGVSSHPTLHSAPIVFNADGLYGGNQLTLEGTLDGREESTDGHTTKIGLVVPSFGGGTSLFDGSDLNLSLDLGFDRGTSALSRALVSGTFQGKALGDVRFSLSGVGARTLELDLTGMNLAGGSVRKPKTLGLDGGSADLSIRLGLDGGALDGAIDLVARDLALSPGSMKEVAGLRASDLCTALNRLTSEKPLSLTLLVGGTTSGPKLRIDDTELATLLTQVRDGLVLAGKQALADEVNTRLAPMQDLVGDTNQKVNKRLENVTKDPSKILETNPDSLERTGRRLGNQLEKSFGGLFGGKDDDEDEKKKNKNKNKSGNKNNNKKKKGAQPKKKDNNPPKGGGSP